MWFSEAISSPFYIIPIRSPRISASSKKWVVIITIHSYLKDLMISQNFHLEVGSNPVVGSSKINICGFRINANASMSFLCSPYDNFWTVECHFEISFTDANILAALKSEDFPNFILSINCTFSITERSSKNTFSYSQTETSSFSNYHSLNVIFPLNASS